MVAREWLRVIADERRLFSYRRLAIILKRDGKAMNLAKIYRLCREEKLTVRKRPVVVGRVRQSSQADENTDRVQLVNGLKTKGAQ